MTALELCAGLRALHPVPEPSVDRVIVGAPETVVRGIAVVWMPTWAALREAEAQGLNVVVAHEPTFYTHYDLDGFNEALAPLPPATRAAVATTGAEKRRWIEEHRMAVIRCHDVLDAMSGGVVDSLAAALGFTPRDYVNMPPQLRIVRLTPPVAAGEVAERLARAFGAVGQPGVAFYGDPHRVVGSLGLGTGYNCDPWQFLALGAGMAVTIDDRIKTWAEPAWAEDSGFPLAVIHHGTSEEWGVRSLARLLAERYPDLKVRLLPQGCTYRWVTAEPLATDS